MKRILNLFRRHIIIMILLYSVLWGICVPSAGAQNAETAEGKKLFIPKPLSGSSEAIPPESSELSLFEEIPVVVTASKKPERVTAAPSIVSIITREEIERMGARTIVDVLRTIPGVDIMKDAADTSQIAVRGLRSVTSSGVKILVDGHALNDPITGGATTLYNQIPLRHVRRIEIIRGPASVSYGANAFVSVVNIITKIARDIDGIEISAGGGSFQTLNPSILFGHTADNVDISVYADYYRTDGAPLTMDADLATLYDEARSSQDFEPISLAPGTFRDSEEQMLLTWKIDASDLSIRGGFLDRQRGPFLTDFFALNDDSEQDARHIYSELEYQRFLTERLEWNSKIYGDYVRLNTREQAGRGIRLPGDEEDEFVLYPNGVISTFDAESWRFGGELRCSIRLLDNNDLTIGAAYEYSAVENAAFLTNVYNAELGLSTNELIDIQAIVPEVKTSSFQSFAAIFLQDTWKVRRNLDLTLGLRGDFFNDVGGVFTPKVGLTYQPDPNLNIKLLFGSAFRIPSFVETYIEVTSQRDESGESNIIDHDLKAEELRTFEIGLGYRPLDWFVGEINYFYTDINELAETGQDDTGAYPIGTTGAYQNIGGIDVQGVEIELRGTSEQEIGLGIIPRIMHTTFRVNYSYQDTKDSTTHENVQNMARHRGNIGVGFNLSAQYRPNETWSAMRVFRTLSDEFSLYFNLFLCGKRERSRDDVRDALPAFGVLDMTLTAPNVFRTSFDVSFSMKNMLNEEYRDPSPELTGTEGGASVPDDLPNPGRMFLLEMRYAF